MPKKTQKIVKLKKANLLTKHRRSSMLGSLQIIGGLAGIGSIYFTVMQEPLFLIINVLMFFSIFSIVVAKED